jgi:hypothetical protein
MNGAYTQEFYDFLDRSPEEIKADEIKADLAFERRRNAELEAHIAELESTTLKKIAGCK